MAQLSLKSKMTAAISLLMVAVVGLLGWGGFWFFTGQLKKNVSTQQYTLVLTIADQLDRQLRTTRRLVEAEASAIEPQPVSSLQQLAKRLAGRRDFLQYFDAGLILYRTDGRVVASSMSGEKESGVTCDFSSRNEAANDRKPVPTTQPLFCLLHNEPAVFFPTPILDKRGEAKAFLAGGLFLAHNNFLGQLAGNPVGRNGFLFLFDRQRRLIAHPDRQRLLQPYAPAHSDPLFERALKGAEGSGETRPPGTPPALSSFKPLSAEDWVLGASYPLAEAYAPVRQAQRFFIPALACLLLISGGFVWWLMRRLTTPLGTLTDYVRNLGRNGLAEPPPLLRRKDEIGLFAATFQQLLTHMRGNEAALAEQLHFLQTLIDTIPNPVFYKDTRGIYLGCNRAFEAYLGRSREALLGMSVYDLSPPDLAEVYHRADLDLFDSGGAQVYEASVQHADGSRHDVVFSKAVFHNTDGSVGGLIGTFLDISERKQAEVALQEQKSFSENLLCNSGAPMFVINTAHQVIAWNRALEILSGKPAPLMLGTSDQWQAFYAVPRPCLADLVLNGESDLDPVRWNYRLLRPSELAEDGLQAEAWLPNLNGRDRYIFFSAAPIRNSQGEIIAVIETLEDITDRQKRQQEIEVFAQVTTSLRAARNRSDIQSITLENVQELSQAQAVSLLFFKGAGEDLVMEQAGGLWAKATGLQLQAGKGIARLALEARQPQVHKLVAGDARIARPDLMQDLAYLACIPLIAHEQAVGALCAGFAGPVREQTLRQLVVIGDIAASALHRSLLNEQTERQLQRLLALRNIDLAITSSFDLRQTLAVFLEQACSQLQADAAGVLLYRPDKGDLEFAAGQGFRAPPEREQPVTVHAEWFAQVVEGRRRLTLDRLAQGVDLHASPLAAGEDFTFCVALPLVAQGQVQGVLEVFHRVPLAPPAEWYEFLESLGTQAAIAIVKATLFENLQRSNMRLRLAYDTTIEGWSRALDLRDKETEGHSGRVSEMTLRLATVMGFDQEQLVHIRRGALLHDIGKMGIPDRILLKSGPLTEGEWEIMRQHPRFGYELLSPIEHLRPALDIPYCHHEKWDGSGYPRGLKGEQIPLAARVFAVVDTWDALRSDRPYRTGWPPEKIASYLQSKGGSEFDPEVVAAFLALDPESLLLR
jgi:PAS domain S-box-containing protein